MVDGEVLVFYDVLLDCFVDGSGWVVEYYFVDFFCMNMCIGIDCFWMFSDLFDFVGG